MKTGIFELFFVAGLVTAEIIRAPHRMRNKQDRREGNIKDSRIDWLEGLLMTLAFAGLWAVPVLYVFTTALDFAHYNLPAPAGVPGTVLLCLGLWLLWRSHADLGDNWSATLEISRGHTLVTGGVYARIRHPIYAAMWLMALAQLLMLPNWIAGPAGVATFLPVYLLRVPREERMMLDHFGAEYRRYMQRTGRIIPRLK